MAKQESRLCRAMFCEEQLRGGKPFCKKHWQWIQDLDRLDILRHSGKERERAVNAAYKRLAVWDGYGEYLP